MSPWLVFQQRSSYFSGSCHFNNICRDLSNIHPLTQYDFYLECLKAKEFKMGIKYCDAAMHAYL